MRIEARAKINLGLEVVRKRPDGYHDIRTLFQGISLARRPGDRGPSGPPRSGWKATTLDPVGRDQPRLPGGPGSSGSGRGTTTGASSGSTRASRPAAASAAGAPTRPTTLLGLNAALGTGPAREELAGSGRPGCRRALFPPRRPVPGRGERRPPDPPARPPARSRRPGLPALSRPDSPDLPAPCRTQAPLTSGPRTVELYGFSRPERSVPWRTSSKRRSFVSIPSSKRLSGSSETKGPDLSLVTGSGSAVFGLFRDRDAAERCLGRNARGAATAVLVETVPRAQGWPDLEAGASPSGKAADFGSAIRGFESSRPSSRL